MKTPKEDWLYEIKPKDTLFSLNFKEIWRYRDLLLMFVKRDVVTLYKQTILGPLWYLIQPLFTSVVFTLIFNNVAGIQTGSIPPFLFNLAGVTVWNYFKECLVATSDTFKKNEAIFGKVYFPRVIMPMSIVVSNLLKFGIQLTIFIAFYLYFVFIGNEVRPNVALVFFPVLVLIMGMLGLGLGMIISSMVTKYRDLTFLVQFGVQLLMYFSLVAYPMSLIEQKIPDLAWMVELNPMAHVIEISRFMLLNENNFSLSGIIYTTVISIVVFFVGLVIFNKTEKSFIDTI
ncbi:ABC transporter permease [Aureivirga sp. CE67]|uniref:ABC transporter permease n=1 Tax=Aureivirga sp. CE67 TaxID=1788983 RepID=UPI0018C8FBC3|nr:ABC transporter permease [Aureivirga sp. CE67]